MPDVREIPQLTRELIELSKEYVRQETLGPAKRLGRTIGMSFLASLSFAVGGVLLSVGTMRLITGRLPDTQLWSAFGVAITAILALVVGGLIMYYAVRVGAEKEEQ